jgi:hypothetical protein
MNLVERTFLKRAELQSRNSLLNPPCSFCRLPTIWRGLTFICPYAESFELHRRIRDQQSREVKRDELRRSGLGRFLSIVPVARR